MSNKNKTALSTVLANQKEWPRWFPHSKKDTVTRTGIDLVGDPANNDTILIAFYYNHIVLYNGQKHALIRPV